MAESFPSPAGEPYLVAEDITVRFGGLTAVSEVSVSADRGEIVGVIGPNGAGKSTLFGAIAGSVPIAGGRVRLGGVDVTRWPSHRRARTGLGRTFQRLEVFGSMTVGENLAFATEAAAVGDRPLRLLSRDRHQRPARVAEVIELLGLEEVVDVTVSVLPVGTARVVQLAIALCGDPHVLLLDEPSSGLDASETAALGDHVARAVGDRGFGVVLIEHDMSLVLRLCTRLHVLNFGVVIASGPTADVERMPAVRDAYLGTGR